MRYLAFIGLVALALSQGVVAQDVPTSTGLSALHQRAWDSVRARAADLRSDPALPEACARHGARAQRVYFETLEVSTRTEAMNVVSEELTQRFAADRLYLCGLLALATTAPEDGVDAVPDPDRLGLAVATGWASANAVPVGDAAAADALFASAAASTLFGLSTESTEALYCTAMRRGSREAGLMLDVWPRTPSCRPGQKPVLAAPLATQKPPSPASPPSRPAVTVASATVVGPVRTEVQPVPAPARPSPPPPATLSAWRDPPPQPLPRAVEAPRPGLSECREFATAYWTDAGKLVTVSDVFCRTAAGTFTQVSGDFTVE